jgi:hypothetical protein
MSIGPFAEVPSVGETLTESSGSIVEGFTVSWNAPSSVVVYRRRAVADTEATVEAKDTALAVFPNFANILL